MREEKLDDDKTHFVVVVSRFFCFLLEAKPNRKNKTDLLRDACASEETQQ